MNLPDAPEKGAWEKVFPVWLDRVTLADFRIFDSVTVAPSAGVNLVCGANAQGKTSLLEAVSLLSTGRLLRGSKDAQAIRHGAATSKIAGRLGESGTEVSIELRPGVRKRVELNGASLPRASDLIGRLPSVSFSAGDLSIVTGEPNDRRMFLDAEISQLYPAYLKNLTIYKKALENRNALLRQAQDVEVPIELFESWEAQMATSGAQLRATRSSWVTDLAVKAAGAHSLMGSGEELGLAYISKDDGVESDALASALSSNRRMEIARGASCFGPHRDDVLIEVGGAEARYFGSQGQQRTAVIAIKLAVLESATEVFRVPPILLLDDVFSDLDVTRRERLMELTLGSGGQVFLTCTEAIQAGQGLVEQSACFWVESGHIRS